MIFWMFQIISEGQVYLTKSESMLFLYKTLVMSFLKISYYSKHIGKLYKNSGCESSIVLYCVCVLQALRFAIIDQLM